MCKHRSKHWIAGLNIAFIIIMRLPHMVVPSTLTSDRQVFIVINPIKRHEIVQGRGALTSDNSFLHGNILCFTNKFPTKNFSFQDR